MIINYPTTTKFHETDFFHPLPHTGTDYALPLFSPVEALEDSVVVSISTNDMLGNNIRLKAYDGKIIVYGHLASYKVKVGDKVSKGDIIALSGGKPGMQGSGHSTGAHLHLSVYNSQGILVDPMPYVIQQEQKSNSSPLVFPIMIILILVMMWKFKKYVLYGIGIILLLTVIFLVS